MSRDVRRGDASRVSRRARRRRPTRTRWRPGEAWSEGRWRARRREAGVHETRSEVGRERARRSKIDRRVARRSGGETRPNRARLRACRPRRARPDQPPAKNRGSIALLLPRVFALPSASRHRRVAFGAPSRGVMSAGTRYADRTMRAAPLAAPAGRDPRRHDRPEARAIEARQKRRPRSFKLTLRRATSRTTG